MSRCYKAIRPQKHRVYSGEDVQALYGISANTLSNWRTQGLRRIGDLRPHLFRGDELIRFHDRRNRLNRRTLGTGEFLCLGCKAGVLPDPAGLSFRTGSESRWWAHGHCPECGCAVQKILGETECDTLRARQLTSTSRGSSDEDEAQVRACIGISEDPAPDWIPDNEQIIFDWQIYAGRYDPKTAAAHLSAIRRFEALLEGCKFTAVRPDEAERYRKLLAAGGTGQRQGRVLSLSSVRHRASYLRDFFDWLAKQRPGFGLDRISDYLKLPKAMNSGPLPRGEKVYITLQQAADALSALPGQTVLQRRNRAIFALAYAGGLRESALISLRLRHLDMEARRITHDGRELRAKNGKSFYIDLFPGTEAFWPEIRAWVAEMESLGAGPEDALFPCERDLNTRGPRKARWPVMKSAFAVEAVFQQAAAILGIAMTPHSARHTLSQFGETQCATLVQYKAWSLNLGHDSPATTLGHYGRMSDAQKTEVLAGIGIGGLTGNSQTQLILNYVLGLLQPGTPEYAQGKALMRNLEDRVEAGTLKAADLTSVLEEDLPAGCSAAEA